MTSSVDPNGYAILSDADLAGLEQRHRNAVAVEDAMDADKRGLWLQCYCEDMRVTLREVRRLKLALEQATAKTVVSDYAGDEDDET